MTYRRLGRTALKVGPIAVGSVNFGWNTGEAESFAMLNFALKHGLNLVDTADSYNGGRSEELIGRFIAKEGKREAIVLATKLPAAQGPRCLPTRENAKEPRTVRISAACPPSISSRPARPACGG